MSGARARKGAADEGVTLSESDGVRYLHFGTEWIQGAMRLARPFDLELEYVRQMMAWGLFLDPHRAGFEILQLGLGAGALTKFCWKRLPHAQVTAIERSPAVIACARSMFAVPHDAQRLTVVECGAAEYVARPRVRGRFDLVQVDLYDAAARGPVEDGVPFYAACREALGDVGIVVVNLFGAHESFGRNLRRLHAVFDARVVALPEIDAGNRVALAFKGPPLRVAWSVLYERAKQLEADWRLPARRWVDGIKREHLAREPSKIGQFAV